jgi:methylated-DNA-[protein]-cysteine S-methyltransferase
MVIECEGHVMGEAPHHYLIFETFCGIAWNNVGITRFQSPTKSAVAAKRTLLRRVPGAERSAPIPEVVEAVAAVKRYFEGEEPDFSRLGHTTTYGTLAKELGAASLHRRVSCEGQVRSLLDKWVGAC